MQIETKILEEYDKMNKYRENDAETFEKKYSELYLENIVFFISKKSVFGFQQLEYLVLSTTNNQYGELKW